MGPTGPSLGPTGPVGPTGSIGALLKFSGKVGADQDVGNTFYLLDSGEISVIGSPTFSGNTTPPHYPFGKSVSFDTLTIIILNPQLVIGDSVTFTLLKNGLAVPGATLTFTNELVNTIKTVSFASVTYGSGDYLDLQGITNDNTSAYVFSATLQG